MKHIAIYLRVSSKTQDTASQEAELKRWAATRDEPIEWYRDSFTGKTMDRPGFSRLEREIAAGNVSTLVVWRLDRLGRTTDGLSTLFTYLRQRKVNLVSLREGLDLSTPAGRLVIHIMSSVAEFETEVRSERQMAGIAAAKARGVKFGRRPGSRKSRIPQEKRTAIIEHKQAGWKVARIARAVGLSRQTVYVVLTEAA
jgi:DNA invertase Pin-like site-specific DNA recombinase